ncbi:MAG: RdgB/HAM1 family non-canonical purine NTP pyrophosphatase [Phycisphaeraceae bacterium]|nr:MAG: RdgB/HAM1 family non-canonical purine NTP pyrophosphatase [Phycisphaeraceae bacterium]
MPLLFATSNPHKLREVEAILAPMGVRIIGLSAVETPDGRRADELPEPEENGDTFEENAAIKARYYARATDQPCLADDSGLEVDALDGDPGVRSARYAGMGETRDERDAANIEKLLTELADAPDHPRIARFVCAMCVAAPDESILAIARGGLEGVIGAEPRGENGFGYDPLLILPDGRTCAELTDEEKNARSHRAAAAKAIAPELLQALASHDRN